MSFASTKTLPAGSTVTLTGEIFASQLDANAAWNNDVGLQRALNNSILSGASSILVTLPVAEPNTSYGIFLSQNFSTGNSLFVVGKSTSNFTLGLSASIGASAGKTFDWLVIS